MLTAAMLLGISDAALQVARDYALEREQFGQPIATFQALKHLMADMFVRTGLARSATYAAAAVLDDPEVGHVGRSVSAAKLLAGEAAIENARAAVQVLGGMGFTWEHAAELPAEAGLGARARLRDLVGPHARHQLVARR